MPDFPIPSCLVPVDVDPADSILGQVVLLEHFVAYIVVQEDSLGSCQA